AVTEAGGKLGRGARFAVHGERAVAGELEQDGGLDVERVAVADRRVSGAPFEQGGEIEAFPMGDRFARLSSEQEDAVRRDLAHGTAGLEQDGAHGVAV